MRLPGLLSAMSSTTQDRQLVPGMSTRHRPSYWRGSTTERCLWSDSWDATLSELRCFVTFFGSLQLRQRKLFVLFAPDTCRSLEPCPTLGKAITHELLEVLTRLHQARRTIPQGRTIGEVRFVERTHQLQTDHVSSAAAAERGKSSSRRYSQA